MVTETVKPGYKRTEVGVVPEDWELAPLENAADVIMGQSPVGTSYNRNGIGAPLINGPTEFTEKYPIKIQWTSQPTKFCKKGDVLLCVRGSSTGRMNFSDDEYCIGRGVAAIRAKSGAVTSFIASQLESAINKILSLTAGSTFPNIDGKSIKAIVFPFPPTKEEQIAIATVLSDTDALIESLNKLIEKKKNIKQGAMQELLTGKRRLPGFSEEWEEKRLGDLGSFKKGKGIKKDQVSNEGLPCIRYGEIYTHHHDYIREFFSFIPSEVAVESQRIGKGDLLFAGSGETAEEIGKCVAFLGDEKAYAGGDVVMFTPNQGDSLFLGYLMNHQTIMRQKSRMAQGQAVVHIYSNNLKEILLPFPDVEEQSAIAQVLSDMDKEIQELEQKRDKYLQIKAGMMQQLLTGKIRLKC